MGKIRSAIENTVSISLLNKGYAGQIFDEVRASGAKAVLGLGARDTFAEFAGVKGIGAREGTLRISYSAQYGAKVSVKVNGTATVVSLPKTTGWPTYATVDVSVKGLSAKNTIRIEGTGEGFHLDWVGLFK